MRVVFHISLLKKDLHAYKHIQRSQFAIFGKDFSKDLSRWQMCHSLFNYLLVKEICSRVGVSGSSSKSIFNVFSKLLSRTIVPILVAACWNLIFLIPPLILCVTIFQSVAICQASGSFLLWFYFNLSNASSLLC